MKLMVFDSNSILNRSFYGMPPLTTADGQPTGAVYGFLNIVLGLIEKERPDCVAAAFDMREKTFRHKQYDQYKATRKGMPDELASQMSVAKEALALLKIPIVEKPGFEADDIIGTFTDRYSQDGYDCIIVTGDRDSLQLINERTNVFLSVSRPTGSETVVYNTAAVEEKYGVSPKQMIDVKAIMGDTSDNVPGVPGIGEKGALALIRQFGSLDGVYAHIDDPSIKPGQRKKLEEGRESAYLSRDLVTIHTGVDIPLASSEYMLQQPDKAALYQLFKRLNFNSLIKRLDLSAKTADKAVISAEPVDGPDLLRMAKQVGEIAFYESGPDLFVCCGGTLYRTEPDDALYAGLFGDPGISKVTYDAKPFLVRMMKKGIDVQGLAFDLKIAAYVLNPSMSSYQLGNILFEQCAVTAEDHASMCALFLDARDKMAGKIRETEMDRLYYEIEMPLIHVLARMEYVGFTLDRDQLASFGSQLRERIDELTETIYFHAGETFNINSTKQLGDILFNKLGLPALSKTKTGYSTNADVLERLRGYHEIIECILEYRRLTKLNSTYVEGFIGLIGADGRIHSSFHQTITQTGRISSSEPNLQNIPVRQPMGKQLRRMFTAKSGCVLVDADYSQIELRVLAHISGDEHMRQAFRADEDIHTKTAAEVFGVPVEMVTPEMRSRAKAVNFGIVYGISDFSLAADIKVPRKEARRYIDSYFETYQGIKRYLDDTVLRARECGYVTTMFGRRRYIPELAAQNHNVRSFGERVAKNTPIQGSAADILKIAMVRVMRRLRQEGMASEIILQVHDELILECPESEAVDAAMILKEEMEKAGGLSIPLKVDIGTGYSWDDAKE